MDTQHGFRSQLSCHTNLLIFYNKVSEITDENKAVDLTYLDFEIVFDKVPHDRLMKKGKAMAYVAKFPGGSATGSRNALNGFVLAKEKVCGLQLHREALLGPSSS